MSTQFIKNDGVAVTSIGDGPPPPQATRYQLLMIRPEITAQSWEAFPGPRRLEWLGWTYM